MLKRNVVKSTQKQRHQTGGHKATNSLVMIQRCIPYNVMSIGIYKNASWWKSFEWSFVAIFVYLLVALIGFSRCGIFVLTIFVSLWNRRNSHGDLLESVFLSHSRRLHSFPNVNAFKLLRTCPAGQHSCCRRPHKTQIDDLQNENKHTQRSKRKTNKIENSSNGWHETKRKTTSFCSKIDECDTG